MPWLYGSLLTLMDYIFICENHTTISSVTCCTINMFLTFLWSQITLYLTLATSIVLHGCSWIWCVPLPCFVYIYSWKSHAFTVWYLYLEHNKCCDSLLINPPDVDWVLDWMSVASPLYGVTDEFYLQPVGWYWRGLLCLNVIKRRTW